MPRKKTPPSDQPSLLDPGQDELSRLTLAELEDRIATLEIELSALKRQRRNRLGGLAAVGRPRKRKFQVDLTLEAYAQTFGPDGRPVWGALRGTATKLGMTERHLSRTISENHGELDRILIRLRKKDRPSG